MSILWLGLSKRIAKLEQENEALRQQVSEAGKVVVFGKATTLCAPHYKITLTEAVWAIMSHLGLEYEPGRPIPGKFVKQEPLP